MLLNGFALGVRSSRKIEQRVREDLGFRYLAGGAEPEPKTIGEFLRRPGRALNDLFTQVLEQLQAAGLARRGTVAIDSTRIRANASRDGVTTEEGLRRERAQKRRQIRGWERLLQGEDPEETPGGGVQALEQIRQRLAEIPAEMQPLRKSGLVRMSRSDADSRFLRERGGFVLGYTAEVGVSEDHFVLAQRVTQNGHDQDALLPVTQKIVQRCGRKPQRVLTDVGFYSNRNLNRRLTRTVRQHHLTQRESSKRVNPKNVNSSELRNRL